MSRDLCYPRVGPHRVIVMCDMARPLSQLLPEFEFAFALKIMIMINHKLQRTEQSHSERRSQGRFIAVSLDVNSRSPEGKGDAYV